MHGVSAWEYDGYRGSTIKIGIIDRDFKGFTNLMGSELPQNTPILTRVHARCYTAMGVHTETIADCEDPCTVACPAYVGHGASVAEIIADVAPSASLYIANPTTFNHNNDLKATVEWMIGEGVKVINHSVGYGIEAPGDGSSALTVDQNHILDIINYAVTNGIIWVNSGGNDAEKTWYGPYREGATDNGWHEFYAPTPDEGNTITLQANTRIVAELRWDDSWGGANCDLNLHLRRLGIFEADASSTRLQTGDDYQHPYEILDHVAGTTANYYLN